MSAEGGRTPILSLTTIAIDRPAVSVDGRVYDVAVLDDFSLARRERFFRLWQHIQQLIADRETRTVYGEPDAEGTPVVAVQGELSFEQEDDWERTYRQMAEIVVRSTPAELCDAMPMSVFDALTSPQRYAIVQIFFQVGLGQLARATGTKLAMVTPIKPTRQPKKPTGGKRSHGSNASTVTETPPDG